MDTIFTLLINAGKGPTIRDGVDGATRPAPAPSPTSPSRTRPRHTSPSTTEERRGPPDRTDRTSPFELDDIQAGALHERPTPYVGAYLLLRIDDRRDGRELVRRLLPAARPERSRTGHVPDAWLTVAFTYRGLEALGVPQASLDSFAPEFRQGMAARAAEIGDVGDNAPEHWEQPLGSPDVHIALSVLSPDADRLETVTERARRAQAEIPGVHLISRQDCYQLPTGRTSFGFKDGIGAADCRGQRAPQLQPSRDTHQSGGVHPRLPRRDRRPPADADAGRARPQRHLHRVPQAAHTRGRVPHLPAREGRHPRGRGTARSEDGGTLAERCTLTLSPDQDDRELGADPQRNNDFLYNSDLRGFKCPAGAHAVGRIRGTRSPTR